MTASVPTKAPASELIDPELLGRVRRGRRYRSVGWIGVLVTVGGFAVTKIAPLLEGESAKPPTPLPLALGLALLAISLLLINWTRIWVQESKQPFQYTFSIGEFERGPQPAPSDAARASSPIDWLTKDLTEKLGERVGRLSLLDDEHVPPDDPEEDPAAHVHVAGWQGLRRRDDGGWMLEVVPKVRLGGRGAPMKLARTVRFRLGEPNPRSRASPVPPKLEDEQYRHLLERVYWSIASQIYAQIRLGVERKVKLLPPGRLRAAAFLAEADDYATSNTLDAYEAARGLYRRALEIYDVSSRRPSGTAWRRLVGGALADVDRDRCRLRRNAAKVLRGLGRREILTARAQLGYARMLVAEWHLRRLCGTVPTGLFEAAPNIRAAITRLRSTPTDVDGRNAALFRAYVTMAMASHYLADPTATKTALAQAERVLPADAQEDPEFLFTAGMSEEAHVRSLRLLGEAVELDPMFERARFHRAQRYEELWRSREPFEQRVAEVVDDEYAAVIAIDPGNVSAWANRGFMGWLMAGFGSGSARTAWKQRGLSALEAGRQYKEVRGEAMVAELDWNLTRFAAEAGDFDTAYVHYVEAVSAMLGEPRLGFLDYFYIFATPTLVKRFTDYRDRVFKAAASKAARKFDPRLVKSVKAFVLNDCGSAHLAYHMRSGSSRAFELARQCFTEAIEENGDFVVALFNLARLEFIQAKATPLPEAELVGRLELVARRFAEVLRREPDWVLPQLLALKVHGELGIWAARRRRELARVPLTSARLLPLPQPPGPDGQPNGNDVAQRRAHLDGAHDRHEAELQALLHKLLPHSAFGGVEGMPSRLALDGQGVPPLLESETGFWTWSFTEIHAAALAGWATALAERGVPATFDLAAELRHVFGRADLELLQAHRAATVARLAATPRDPDLLAVKAECDELIESFTRVRLRMDPANYFYLTDSVLRDEEERRELLSAASTAPPSSLGLAWIAVQQSALGVPDAAVATARQALRAPELEGGAALWEGLGHLLASRGDVDGALEAYARAIAEADLAGTPGAAANAAHLLREAGKNGKARQALRSAARKPEIAFALAAGLASNRPEDAALVYRDLIERAGEPEETRTRARLALARMTAAANPTESEAMLRAAVAEPSAARHEAALELAETLEESEPSEAKGFYELAIAEGTPATVLTATLRLASPLEGKGEADEALELYLAAAATHGWIAICIGDIMLRAERTDVAERIYKAGALAVDASPDYAAAAALRLADLLAGKGSYQEAAQAYEAVVMAKRIWVAADAAVSWGEMALSLDPGLKLEDFHQHVALAVAKAPLVKTIYWVGYCREIGQRLEDLGRPECADAVQVAVARAFPGAIPTLASALEASGAERGAELVREQARVAAAAGL